MKFLLLSALVAVALAHPHEKTETDNDLEQWELFKVQHEREYENEEEELKRKAIFRDNLNTIKDHNAKYERGETTFYMAVNQFADLTHSEFKERMNGLRIPKGHKRTGEKFEVDDNITLPSTVDWRKEGAVTPVKDQGNCGSCWAFSATGSLEGRTFLKTEKLVSLSEQNLVDCSRSEGNEGCNGGLMDQAFTYIQKNSGIDTEESYPYEGVDKKCRYKKKNKGATDSGFIDIPEGKEDKLQAAVAEGPVSVAIDASQDSFQFYSGGIYIEKKCSSEELDHGVLAIGYGKTKKGAYWLVKNSWGESWGMKGYIMMARNHKNMCGIATLASFPKV